MTTGTVAPAPATRLLTLDGGGMRGLITAVWLHRMQEQLARPLAACFDAVAGTSTGSILAAAVGSGRSTDDVIALYQRHGEQVFRRSPRPLLERLRRRLSQGLHPPRYDGAGLRAVLMEVFGTATLGDVLRRTLITCYAPATRSPVVLDSDEPAHRAIPLWEACLASSSLPGLFPAHRMRLPGRGEMALVDGGVFDYNPLLQVLSRLIQETPEAAGTFVAGSLGTGISRSAGAEERAREAPADEPDLGWAGPAVMRLLGGSAPADLRSRLHRSRYHRLQVEVPPELAGPDVADGGAMSSLLQAAQEYLDDGGNRRLTSLVRDLAAAAAGR